MVRRKRPRKPAVAPNKRLETVLGAFAGKLGKAKALKPGYIVLRLAGNGGGDYAIRCTAKSAKVQKSIPAAAPLIEVIGEVRKVTPVLEGKRDGRTQFLAGGLRVRGDIPYLSDLALEIGFIKEAI